MKSTSLLFASLILVAVSGCGNSGSPTPPGPGPKPIDPSGNWSMTATDGGGKSVQFAALFAQIGSVVTSNSFTATGNGVPFSCVPFTASLSNGQVLNVSNFTGDVIMGGNFGTFSFNTTLSGDGKSTSGTFANMPPCTGLLTSGTFTGAEVPSISGSWTGTLQPCAYDQITGTCTLFGKTSPITAVLSQNDASGNVTGSYQTTGLSAFSSGTIAVVPPFDILSGNFWQFTMTDNNGTKFVVCGGCTPGGTGLDLQGHFVGVIPANFPSQTTSYWLVASH
jgi:hypothetical protein